MLVISTAILCVSLSRPASSVSSPKKSSLYHESPSAAIDTAWPCGKKHNINPNKLETGVRTISAGMFYAFLLWTEAIGRPTFGVLLSTPVPLLRRNPPLQRAGLVFRRYSTKPTKSLTARFGYRRHCGAVPQF